MRMTTRITATAAALALTFILAACAQDEDTVVPGMQATSGQAAGETSTVDAAHNDADTGSRR